MIADSARAINFELQKAVHKYNFNTMLSSEENVVPKAGVIQDVLFKL